METKYNHFDVEKGKYAFWLKQGFFKAGDKSKEPFTIVIPPPNVTGKLHLGHAWDTTLQDIIIRRKRMQGFDALWVPGMDHAGIATQAKVDERLRKMQIDKYKIGRKAFLEYAWGWKEEYSEFIRNQWASLGLSLDYSKERFTLDEGLNKAVTKVFIDLYNKGLIYRGEKIINWDVEAKTALSNIEVEHKETKGAFYYIIYPFVDENGGIEVATTRPETMFADQAIMVNPSDMRYKHLIGRKVYIPKTDKIIPIIADEYVDASFKTGCVKVTPAHDQNDFEVGKRHNLKMPLCMNEDGTMNEIAFQYANQDRFICRKNLVKDLKNSKLLTRIEEVNHQVGYSERTDAIVEPRLSKQWFVKMDPLAKQALKEHKLNFIPERFVKIFNHWLENIQDWCISRQLWWGHAIPAWYKDNQIKVQELSPGEGWVQDNDVLDTWFSSALWPFSVLGWPEKTNDFNRYYPNNVLVTGYDIIFFWVSRMVFQGIEFTNETPFKDVLIHGLVRDEKGQKMSKSLGNGIDPIDVINQYGADTLRYFLTTNTAPGMDLRFEKEKVESSWNYINKIWNVARYIKMNTEDIFDDNYNEKSINKVSRWILAKLNNLITEVNKNYDKYEFGLVAHDIYSFIWDDFAAKYIEFSKVDIANNNLETKKVLKYVLDKILKLLHPFMPFVTEEIYMQFNPNSIMGSIWPTNNKSNKINDILALEEMEKIFSIISNVRNVRQENNKSLIVKLSYIISIPDHKTYQQILNNEEYLLRFTNPKEIKYLINEIPKGEFRSVIEPNFSLYFPLDELINLESEISRVKQELIIVEAEIERAKQILNNQAFLDKAPSSKINLEKDKLNHYQEKKVILIDSLRKLQK